MTGEEGTPKILDRLPGGGVPLITFRSPALDRKPSAAMRGRTDAAALGDVLKTEAVNTGEPAKGRPPAE
ncbi:hypothetical protein [Actinomadura sp. RB99]|uniref:hypothetical protein n=1 Tax=Actinomadura sp. RB99 TaxID=2691577 RepID=UPI0016889948|nr:hypothetical protein [Actinomadura sp. RB99]